MSLRDQVVEAMADVLAADEYPLREQRMSVPELVASHVLDALLDVLEVEAEDWWDQAGDVANRDPLRDAYETWAGDLIAVLRDSVGVEVDQ